MLMLLMKMPIQRCGVPRLQSRRRKAAAAAMGAAEIDRRMGAEATRARWTVGSNSQMTRGCSRDPTPAIGTPTNATPQQRFDDTLGGLATQHCNGDTPTDIHLLRMQRIAHCRS